MELPLLRQKFRGSILGVLVGDCLGSPYENQDILSKGDLIVLQKSFDKLESGDVKAPVMQYSDDSAMTLSVGTSLVEKGDFDVTDLAKKFVKNYYKNPHRGYGTAVVAVFQKLRGNKFSDIVGPARQQFNGRGSLGNGGAMRIAPIALFYHRDYEKLLEICKSETRITHTHKLGVDGAILQAIAIQQSLLLNPEDQLDCVKFVQELMDKMDDIEIDQDGLDLDAAQPYKAQLGLIKDYLKKEEDLLPGVETVVKDLGHDVTAIGSVPTAIFCFLRAQKKIGHVTTDNPLRRAIQYAISLGGDTDTIASMTGALSGAFYGETKISRSILKNCQDSKDFRNLADKLYEISVEKQ